MIMPIEKERIPYRFEMRFEDIYTFEIHYNSEHDFFTIGLMLGDEVLVYGEKLSYGIPLFEYADERFPDVTIIPKDEAGNESEITYNNFMDTVFLYIEDAADE
ncbi:hypothetical protein F9U64_01155 [Gracilibacillus oryzae]|uniref:Cyanophage baseplate Pam3 plug gp18 domain-containing protein n=1 Tax=Gracilibacillus oryzae TaxID=1672701 RepID=A0A7C8L1V9_9BACI|nr:hypothetical protein [Gracilibacillus oryzae]KAB8139261.1 hypothetical protein F9U64_01155 [Gracilibacillus oryzae]